MFLLPVVSTFLFGYIFDLREYGFENTIVYDNDAIKSHTQITQINDLVAEYRLIESQAQYREFLGVDVATGLKSLVDQYGYRYGSQLKYNLASNADKLIMALKLNLRTVNETVPFDAPQKSEWELRKSIGTHYVKSIIYGSDVFLILKIITRNSEHKTAIKKSILSSLGRSGTLDASFKEKFLSILGENNSGYFTSSFGTVPFFADNVPPQNINDMLALKDNLANIMKTVNDGKGAALFFEMQPISFLSSKFPLVEINSEIFNKLQDVEMKYEDLVVAIDQFRKWQREEYTIHTSEEERKISEFNKEVKKARGAMGMAIRTMDISTLGSIDQFSEAMTLYGNTNDTHKYRKMLEQLRQLLSSK